MKYNIQAGKHPAEVELNMDGKGGFTGTITHTEYGDGQITGGQQNGEQLTGKVVLDGHNADFKATVSGASISGAITVGWFFSQDFSGIQAA